MSSDQASDVGNPDDTEDDVRTTAACPECDSTPVKVRTGKLNDDDVEPGSYRCENTECGARFDEPKIRESGQVQPDSAGGLSGPGRALVEMDPEDWPPDDGELVTDGGQDLFDPEESEQRRRDPLTELLDDEWETVIEQREPYPNRVIDESEGSSEDDLATDGGRPHRYRHAVISPPSDASGGDAARDWKDRLFEHRNWDDIEPPEDIADLDSEALVAELEQDDDELLTDGGSKYTVQTGDGYLGVATVRRQSAEFSIASWPFDWPDGTSFLARQTDDRLVLEPIDGDPESSTRCRVSGGKKRSPVLVVPGSALDSLDVEAGDDVRAYLRDNTVAIVPADPDPMLEAGGAGSEPVTDGGFSEWVELTAPRRDILVAIAAADDPTGVGVREILADWRGENVHQGGFSRLVNDLEYQGLVESDREGKHKRYRLTEEADSLLRSRIIEAAELLDVDLDVKSGGDVDDDRPANALTDGGQDRYRCGLCGDQHETRADALTCCSDRFEDVPLDSPRHYRTDGGQQPLLDVSVAKDPVAVLRADPSEHGWSIETTVENSREYVGDGVEAVTGVANCYVTDPSALRALADEALQAAEKLEARGPPVTDGGQDVVERLRELGLTERQIELFRSGRESVRDVFWTLDLHGELRLDDLKIELDYSDTTIHRSLDSLEKGYGIVATKQDPDDGRRTIYYVDEPENREPEQSIKTDGGIEHPSIDPDELDDGGRDCGQCGGTIVTESCIITVDDFSQIRVCTDCGAHGVRHAVFGEDIETVAGPVYDDRLAFVNWDADGDGGPHDHDTAAESGVSGRA